MKFWEAVREYQEKRRLCRPKGSILSFHPPLFYGSQSEAEFELEPIRRSFQVDMKDSTETIIKVFEHFLSRGKWNILATRLEETTEDYGREQRQRDDSKSC